jgi:hypothetical protein
MSPFKITNELFRDKVSGEKIAIVTRIKDSVVSEIVQLLTGRGLQVRVITGQSGVQDWCFMKHAQKELVGSGISTFFKWAAFLGNATSTRLYMLDSPRFRQRRSMGNTLTEAAHLINSDVGSRIRYEVYRSEDIEELIKNGNATLSFGFFDRLLELLESNKARYL